MLALLEPISREVWDFEKAAHLLNRAGFGGTLEDAEQLAHLSPQRAVDHFVNFQESEFLLPAWIGPGSDKRKQFGRMRMLPEDERKAMGRQFRQEQREHMQELRRWWIDRMVKTPNPLEEKLTLFWHGHFATSVRKVKAAYAMFRQNETFRKHAAGNWRTLLLEASKEPAMLIYLDNARSRQDAPNENFARELMELFTLGEGHYSEQDIKQAARALTGWSMYRDRFAFRFRRPAHDAGRKTFMGHTGKFDGTDIIEIILKQKQASKFICRRLWEFFAYSEPEPEVVTGLAYLLRRKNYEFRPVLKTMFRSKAFYSERAIRMQIKSPTQWLVGVLKCGNIDIPAAQRLTRGLEQLGQLLFAPPNVKGWDGGYAWVTAASLIQRYNLAGMLLHGSGRGRGPMGWRADPADDRLMLPRQHRESRTAAMEHLVRRVFLGEIREKDRTALSDYMKGLPAPRTWGATHVRDLVHFMMSTPAYQLT
jgi:uncharacterized protein (DUF1800 family)